MLLVWELPRIPFIGTFMVIDHGEALSLLDLAILYILSSQQSNTINHIYNVIIVPLLHMFNIMGALNQFYHSTIGVSMASRKLPKL